ncbi:hypothetical protein [Singulisphaera sp. PoT]|uniref:hypothetical protein n=1 Tax=Singulisphaera sp. PoT TaxID=3411797 RepID=UPI003BF557CC
MPKPKPEVRLADWITAIESGDESAGLDGLIALIDSVLYHHAPAYGHKKVDGRDWDGIEELRQLRDEIQNRSIARKQERAQPEGQKEDAKPISSENGHER